MCIRDRSDDRFLFAGDTEQIIQLINAKNGLKLPKTERFKLGSAVELIEAVIPANSDLAGKTLKQNNFRERFDAAVVAIHRNGERLSGKLGEITLAYGDLLLLTTGNNFGTLLKRTKDLYQVSFIQKMEQGVSWKKKLFLLLTLLTVGAMLLGFIEFVEGLIAIFGIMMLLKMMSTELLKKNINLDLLVVLGCALTLGTALIDAGAADLIATGFFGWMEPLGPRWVLGGLFVMTLILTSFVTNIAAVSIAFPIAFAVAGHSGVDPNAYYLSIAFAASAAFLTPVSYQTNLMIYGPGNYKFMDFIRVGWPLTVIYSVIVLVYLNWMYFSN